MPAGALARVRRQAPLAVCLLYCTVWAGYITADYWPLVNSPGALLLLYTAAATRPLRSAAAAAVAVAGVWVYAGLVSPNSSMWSVVVQSVMWPTVVCLFGYGARQLAERNQQLALLATRLRREQEERARRAVVDERVHIARELHDMVAHHLSVIYVQAGLARYVLDSDRATVRTALGAILDTSGEALAELRRMLGLLRVDPSDDGESYAPVPGLAQLDDLVDRVRAAGVSVEVVVTGVPRPMAPGIDLCAYRVVQEGLTNVLKHAALTRATVTLRYDASRLTATVADEGRQPVPAQDRGSTLTPGERPGGYGLIGMRERARLYGGTLTAGPRPQGGFEVILTLPLSTAVDEVKNRR